jgi:hypothetical protein
VTDLRSTSRKASPSGCVSAALEAAIAGWVLVCPVAPTVATGTSKQHVTRAAIGSVVEGLKPFSARY